MNEADITARVGRKANALRAVAAAYEASITAKSDLETINNHYTLEGLEGSNEKQRTADLIAKIITEREGAAQADKTLREARFELDIASLRVQETTMLLTLLHGPDR